MRQPPHQELNQDHSGSRVPKLLPTGPRRTLPPYLGIQVDSSSISDLDIPLYILTTTTLPTDAE